MPIMHKLLEKQIQRLRKRSADGNYSIDSLLDIVSQTYCEGDEERRRKDRSMQLVSDELLELNRKIRDESETYVSTILENIVDGIITYSSAGDILTLNGSAQKMFQTSAEKIRNRSVDLLTPREGPTFREIYQKQFRGGKQQPVYETLGCGLKGKTFPIELTISEMNTDTGPLYIAVVRDITERKTGEQQIIQAKEIALQASESKSNFLSTMSHEIRTPMNAVIGLTNLLLQENPREDQLDTLKTLKFSSENLLILINDILDVNKIEAGKMRIEDIIFNLHEMLGNIEKSMQPKVKSQGIGFHTLLDTDLPVKVTGDPTRLTQILINLVSNAIKFTEQGEVNLTVKKHAETDDSWLIYFAVQDTGIGIEESKQELIFDRFTQSTSETNRIYGGSGLGLTITKRLLELLNSRIEVESKPGKGSIFSFILALGKPEDQRREEGQDSATESELHRFKGETVLLVEDNLVNQMVARRFLEKWNLEVDTADNGQVALEMVQKKDYNLVLMDLQMPVLNGYEASLHIRQLAGQKFNSLPIIALTASVDAAENALLQRANINGYVCKPFNPVELNQAIFSLLKSAN